MRGKQVAQRHVGEQGVGIVDIAVRQGQLERLDGQVDGLRLIVPELLQVEPFQEL
jgi:hypothetical protein